MGASSLRSSFMGATLMSRYINTDSQPRLLRTNFLAILYRAQSRACLSAGAGFQVPVSTALFEVYWALQIMNPATCSSPTRSHSPPTVSMEIPAVKLFDGASGGVIK